MKAYSGDGFTFFYPADLSISSDSPLEDFQIHTLMQNKQVVLKIYVGNQPDFPLEESGDPIAEATTASGLAVRSVARTLDDGRQDREVLLDLSSDNDWPHYIHFWYESLNPELAATADEIIESLQTGPPRNTL